MYTYKSLQQLGMQVVTMASLGASSLTPEGP